MAQAQGQMEQSAARVPMIVAVASLVLLAVVVVIMLGLRIWVIGPVKYATRQVDELVEGIRNNRGDITRRIRVKSGDEVGRLSMAINDLVAQGKAVLMISSELPEILGMCDRIYVMNEGRMIAELPAKEASQESIMGYIMQDSKKEIGA